MGDRMRALLFGMWFRMVAVAVLFDTWYRMVAVMAMHMDLALVLMVRYSKTYHRRHLQAAHCSYRAQLESPHRYIRPTPATAERHTVLATFLKNDE